MDGKIRIGILGYGNLGRGVELAVKQNEDMEIAAFFTRRDPDTLKTLSPEVPVLSIDDAIDYKDNIVYIKMMGACANCQMLDITLKDGIEAMIIEEVPEVKEVKVVG